MAGFGFFTDQEWKCLDDAIRYRAIIDANRVFKFYLGLKVEYDEVSGRIIGRNPLPSINEVRREESQRCVMLKEKNEPNSIIEGSSFVTAKAHAIRRSGPNLKKNEEKPWIWCSHGYGVTSATNHSTPKMHAG